MIGDWFRVVSWSLFGWGLVSVAVVGVRKAMGTIRPRWSANMETEIARVSILILSGNGFLEKHDN